MASVAIPNEVHLRFKQLADECELLALNLSQSAKAKQRRQWLSEMKVILDNMDELIDAQRLALAGRNVGTIARQPAAQAAPPARSQ